MMLWKCCTQYVSKFGKLSSGHRAGNGQLSFETQRKAMRKNAQTTALLHSLRTLVNSGQNYPSHDFKYVWTMNFQMFNVVLEKAEGPEIKFPTSAGSSQKQESSRKTGLLTMPQSLTVWITTNCGKFWKRWENQTTWPASWETCM